METIYYSKQYNRRHCFVIAVCSVIVLLLQFIPYHAFDTIPDEHGICVLEIPADPGCTEGGSTNVYVIKNGTSDIASHIDNVSSCEEYLAKPVSKPAHGIIWELVSLAIVVIDIIIVLWLVVTGCQFIFKWLFED